MQHRANWLRWCISIQYGILRDGICGPLVYLVHWHMWWDIPEYSIPDAGAQSKPVGSVLHAAVP